jgi:TPR repeat protein
VPVDVAHAVQLFKQACDGGNAWGCAFLGSAYEKGEGVPADPVRAAELRKQACDGGGPEVCNSLKKEASKPPETSAPEPDAGTTP